MKICLIASSGGHLYQLHVLRAWWQKTERFWITFRKADALSLLHGEKVYWAHWPTTRNLKNFILNLILAFRILRREKPDIIVSTGAGVAVPFFYLGKILGSRLIFIEVYDRIDFPTLSGRMIHPIADAFLLQWPEQKKSFSKGILIGPLL